MPAAARLNDFHVCTATSPAPHVGGPVIATSASVLTNRLPQATTTNVCVCAGGKPDVVVTGAATVLVDGGMAARMTDKTMHGGAIVVGAGDVLIGGPTGGATLGSVENARTACEAAKATRHTPGKAGQSYGNCGLEAWRMALNTQRERRGLPPLTEDEMMQQAIAQNAAGNDPVNKPWAYGATDVNDRSTVMGGLGMPVSPGTSDALSVQQAVADGRAISVSVHPTYWPDATADNEGWIHEVAVTGIKYGPDGKPTAYFINDTGYGICGWRIPAADFERALIPGAAATVSNQGVW